VQAKLAICYFFDINTFHSFKQFFNGIGGRFVSKDLTPTPSQIVDKKFKTNQRFSDKNYCFMAKGIL